MNYVLFSESPVFKIKPRNVTQIVGKPAWVDCAGTGTPTPKVSYHKTGKKELNETHVVTLSNGTLFIKELKKEDHGPYDCWLTQRQSIVAEPFSITVLGMFYFASNSFKNAKSASMECFFGFFVLRKIFHLKALQFDF